MAKRTKKQFKSNLKLEALEQRQLLAGVTGSGTEVGSNIVAANKNVYDQVLLTGTSVNVTNDPGQITRVSFLDLQGDIVQAEFSGAGTLTVSMDTASAVAGVQPKNYNQTVTGGYEQGLASFTIQGSDATTNLSVFSVGKGNAVNAALFDTTHTGGNNTADVQRVTIVANPGAPNGSTFGSIFAGNAIFTDNNGTTAGSGGVVGITAANVQVQNTVSIGDIKAAGAAATPTLVFGTNSQFGAVTVAGGSLNEANGKSINNSGSYAFGVNFAAGATSAVVAGSAPDLPAQVAAAGLSFTGSNPIAALTKSYTLTTGVDTIVGTNGTNAISGQVGALATSPTLTALDSITGGSGANSLTINDVSGSTALPTGVTIKNIQTLNWAAAGAATLDTSATSAASITGLTSVNVLASTGADVVKAGAGQAVSVFDTAGLVTLDGGSTQTVTTAGGLKLGATTGAAGAIVATDTAQGTTASQIDGGTTVTLTNSATATGTTSTGAITIGGVTKPTGAVVITDALTGDATYAGAVTGGTITVNGGTTVSVTETATSPASVAALATNQIMAEAPVKVNGSAATTTVTVVEAPALSQAGTVIAIPAATEVDAVTFNAMTAGQKLTVAGLTYVAPAGGATANQVAAAFANLNSVALSKFTSGPATNNVVTFTATGSGASKTAGANAITITPSAISLVDTLTFSPMTAVGQTVTILGNTFTSTTGAETAAFVAGAFQTGGTVSFGGQTWTASSAAGATVTYTATNAADTQIVPTGTATLPTVSQTGLAAAVAPSVTETVVGLSSTGASGRGGVTNSAVTIVDGAAAGVTNTISTVSLTNYGNSTITSNALTSLTLTNTAITTTGGGTTGTVGITNTVATSLDLTLNAGQPGTLGAITAPTYTTIKAHLTGSDTSATITDAALTALTVDGTKKLTLTAGGLSALQTVAVSGSASFTSSTLPATVTDINGSTGSGALTVTLPTAATTFEGGSGSNNVTITNNPTVAISGGTSGKNTLTVNTTLLPIPSSNNLITGFQTLATGGNSLSLDATGFAIVSNGNTGAAFTNVANGTPLTSSGGDVTYTLKSPTGSDTLAITASGTSKVTVGAVSGVTIPTVTIAGSTSGNSAVTLVDAGVTAITVTNGGSTRAVTLTTTGDTSLTSVDASAMGNATFTYVTAGTTAETVKAGAGTAVLTSATGTQSDVLKGGAGNDTITANAGLDTLSGGAGNDTFVFPAVGANLNTYSTITDAHVGDVLQLKGAGGTEVFSPTKVTLQNTAVFQDYANTVAAAGGSAAGNGYVSWFQFNGDTYVVQSLHNNTGSQLGFIDGIDQVVKLQGLVDLSNSTLLMNGTTPEIVIR